MANDIKDYILHRHDDPIIKTVGDFVFDQTSIAFGMKVDEFLNYEDVGGNSNWVRISSALTDQEVKDNKTALQQFSSSIPLKPGTILAIPLSKANRDILRTESNQVIEVQSFPAFVSEALDKLLTDQDYVQVTKLGNNSGVTKNIYPNITVWMWCRSLSKDNKLEGQLIDLTPFVHSLNTNVGKNGGNFNISLSPIIGKFVNGIWEIDKKNISGSERFKSFHAHSNLHKINNTSDSLDRNNFYFNRVIQENDVVFIRLESLKNELAARVNDDNKIDISNSDLPNKIYDMIGLVDGNVIAVNPANNDVTINVTGRDLMKLFIEDGTYFYAQEFTADGIFGNIAEEDRPPRFQGRRIEAFQQANKTIAQALKYVINTLGTVKICPDSLFQHYGDKISKAFQLSSESIRERNSMLNGQVIKGESAKAAIGSSRKVEKIDKDTLTEERNAIDTTYGEIYDFLIAADKNKSITETRGFPFWNKFTYRSSVVEENVCPISFEDNLFKVKRVWRDSRGRILGPEETLLLKDAQDLANKLNQKDKLRGLSEINDTSEETVDPRKLNDPSDLNAFINELNAQKQEEIQRSFIAETTIQSEDVEAVKKRYEALIELNSEINLYAIPKSVNELSIEQKNAIHLVWEYIKENKNIQQDKGVFENKPLKGIWQIIKLVIDESISERRIIDPSLGNENGSMLNSIRRICQEPFVEFFSDTYFDQFYLIARKLPFDKKSFTDLARKATVIINDEDVLGDTLELGRGEAFSWYILRPQNLLAGDENMAFTYLKAIYFKEYADIWGSRPLDIYTNYIPYYPIVGNNANLSTGYAIKQGLLDLKYIIDTHAYLPFTRWGTITINGDRRIKKGMTVHLNSTGEVFYIDNVSQNYSISDSTVNRTTTLQVSRGMIFKDLDKYFNIVNTDIDEKLLNNDENSIEKIFQNWKVNPDVFSYFIKRSQFNR